MSGLKGIFRATHMKSSPDLPRSEIPRDYFVSAVFTGDDAL